MPSGITFAVSITRKGTHKQKALFYNSITTITQNAQSAHGGDMPNYSQSNKYLLTINNPKEKGLSHEKIKELLLNLKTLKYFAMADEIGGKTQTYHTHLFLYFSSRVRFSTIQNIFPNVHIDKSKGTVSENVNYICKSGKWEGTEKEETKVEGTFEEGGTKPKNSLGKNSALTELYEMINDGMSNAEILATNQDYIMDIDRIDKVRTTILTDRYKDDVRLDLEVTYISGVTGTGKTRGVFESNGYSNVYRVTDYDHPFDGYACQPVICFDEFRSSIRLKDMLLYCDVYPIELPCRYVNKFACYNKVYIVSNWPLEKQYIEIQRGDLESWDAFLRRIHKVVVYDRSGIKTEYSSVKEYLSRNDSDYEYVQGKLPFD